jgi:hypothetical protein
VESNLLPYHLRSDPAILHLGKNRSVQICKLAFALEKQMIVSACARSSPPVVYPLFQTAIAIVKDSRKLAFAAVGNRLAAEENYCSIAFLSIS